MNKSNTIRAGRAFVELFADDSKLVGELLCAVAAWADGQIDNVSLLAAVWAAAQACFIRAGVANEVHRPR